MWRVATLCGLCLVLTGSAASGAPLNSSSGRRPPYPQVARPGREQGRAHNVTVEQAYGPRVATVRLLGNKAVEPRVDGNLVGTVEAFAFRARRSGAATSINVYLDARNRATTLFAGLYSSRYGHPRSLLTSGLRRSSRAGAWNPIAVGSTALRSGQTYWLAILGRGGAIHFRDRNARSCTGERSSKRKSRSLPRRWPAGPNSHVCLISAYVKGTPPRNNATGASGGGTTGSTGGGSLPVDTVQPYFTPSVASNTDGTCRSGCAIQGQTLSVTQGSWSNSPASYSYQWQDCTTIAGTDTGVAVQSGGASNVMTPPTTASCSNISGATSSSYTIGASDVGHALAVNVTATNARGSSSTVTTGSCSTGLMTTTWSRSTDLDNPIASTYFNNGQPGCSPISAVVGAGQYGTSTSGEHFCTNAPTTCGFADMSNAGVPQGAVLYAVPGTCTSPSGPGAGCAATGSGWSYSGGQITMSSNSVLQNVSFAAGVNANNSVVFASGASNVTIQDNDLSDGCNCQFQTAGGVITLATTGTNITIRNNDIHGVDVVTAGHGCNAGIFGGASQTNVQITNNNIYWCATGLNQQHAYNGGWAIDDNYIHDFAWGDSAKSNHFDGIQFEGGGSANSLTYFVNNTDLADEQQTDAIILSNDGNSPNTYRWISHNLIAGGDTTLYVAGTATYPTTHSTFDNNVFSQIYMGDHNTRSQFGGGTFGPSSFWTASTNTWSNGIWDDTGGAVTPDTCNQTPGHFCP